MFDPKSFESEYLNGVFHGKGKEYYLNTNLKFEGEFFNGKWWNGKLFDYFSDETYELKNGNGYLKIYNNEDLEFEGDFLNCEKNGKGKEYFCNVLYLKVDF